VDPELSAREPLGGVAVEADDVLARGVRREGELPLAAVHLHHNTHKVQFPSIDIE